MILDNIKSAFGNLIEDNDSDFADVTLACEDGHQLKAHKVILDGSRPVIDKSLDLEKSREEMTPYFLARSRKLIFHFSFYSRFSRFLEKNSISLLDL